MSGAPLHRRHASRWTLTGRIGNGLATATSTRISGREHWRMIFSYWTWGRYPVSDGTVAFYDAERRDGSVLATGIHFDANGTATIVEKPPPKTRFARNYWLVRRETRADPGYRPREVTPMLHAPFYARAAVRTQIDTYETVGVHEALDLDRFASRLLKPMLAVPSAPRAGLGGVRAPLGLVRVDGNEVGVHPPHGDIQRRCDCAPQEVRNEQ